MDHRTCLARGAVADVFACDDGRVIKLYRAGIQAATVAREAANARAARAGGLPTPAVLDVTTEAERSGIVFERVHGPTMLETLVQRPAEAARLAHLLADLQAAVFRVDALHAPRLRTRLAERIEAVAALPETERRGALKALEDLPEGDGLCHGDLHPANVLLTPGGPMIIDWLDATRGDPAADLARSSLVMLHAELPGNPPRPIVEAVTEVRAAFHAAWLARHAHARPDVAARLHAWMLPVAAARLTESLPGPERERIRRLVSDLAGVGPHPTSRRRVTGDVPRRDDV